MYLGMKQRLEKCRHVLQQAAGIIRAGDYWEYKIIPTLMIFYASSMQSDAPVRQMLYGFFLLILALFVGAAFVSLSNDWADRADDLVAGKYNRLHSKTGRQAFWMIAAPIFMGLIIAIIWRNDYRLLFAFAAAWIVFACYSLQPIRLKARGFWGVMADALGSQILPAMMAILLAYGADAAIPHGWLLSVLAWSSGYGLRGILWHQLLDNEHDRKSTTRTFVQLHSAHYAAGLGCWLAFPIELCGLFGMFTYMGSAAVAVAIMLYYIMVDLRVHRFLAQIIIVQPQPRDLLLMQEFYTVFMPLTLLFSIAWCEEGGWILLCAHLLLFPMLWTQVLRDLWKMRKLALVD